jgi:MFS family permease
MLLVSGILHMLCFLPQALAKQIWLVIFFRSIQGIASSGANSLVGGLVADVGSKLDF